MREPVTERTITPGGERPTLVLYFTPLGQSGPLCDLQTKLGHWPGAVGSQAGQWEEGESTEIKPRAPGSGPGIPEAGSSNAQAEEASYKHGLGFLRLQGSCHFFIVLLLLR